MLLLHIKEGLPTTFAIFETKASPHPLLQNSGFEVMLKVIFDPLVEITAVSLIEQPLLSVMVMI